MRRLRRELNMGLSPSSKQGPRPRIHRALAIGPQGRHIEPQTRPGGFEEFGRKSPMVPSIVLDLHWTST